MEDRFIVAEISKSWPNSNDREIVAQKFERVINTNFKRGYELRDWKLNSVINNGIQNETIIAVFEKVQTQKL